MIFTVLMFGLIVVGLCVACAVLAVRLHAANTELTELRRFKRDVDENRR